MVSLSNTNIFQLNSHKSLISLNTFFEETFTGTNNIALIQEPPLKSGRCIGVPTPLTCLTTTAKPRAAIIHNPSLEIWQVPHLSDRDCQTAIWHNDKMSPILLISAYWDITSPTIPHCLTKAVTEAINKRYHLFIGIDANTHHPAWGSPDTNSRGTMMEAFLTNINMYILNEGNTPTFRRKNCATHIDITAISTSLTNNVLSWKVLDTDMLSDHACLHTILQQTTTHTRSFLNHKKTNWSLFTNLLTENDWSLPSIASEADLDNTVNEMTQKLIQALTDSTPTAYLSGKARKVGWWTEELRQLRRKLRIANKQIDPQNDETTSSYQKLRSAYNKALRKAKRDSWLSFIDSCTSISDTSKLTRIITKARNPPPSLTINPDGSPTWCSLESIQNIMQTLFPGSTTTKPTTTNSNQTDEHHDGLETDSWINQESIEAIINQLPPKRHLGRTKSPTRCYKNYQNR
jgi:hypothetical protein